jgi:hypothetical protein
MRVAQAEHRRGHIAAAGTWAHKAIAIDPTLPEAYAIVAVVAKKAFRRASRAWDAWSRVPQSRGRFCGDKCGTARQARALC